MQAPARVHDSDALLLRFGAELSSALAEVRAIPSPLTRSALVVFEDSLQDDQDVAEVLMHLGRLREGLGDAVPFELSAFLEAMMHRLGTLRGEHSAAMLRSGFFQRRGTVPA
jgi:hypothetical protein